MKRTKEDTDFWESFMEGLATIVMIVAISFLMANIDYRNNSENGLNKYLCEQNYEQLNEKGKRFCDNVVEYKEVE